MAGSAIEEGKGFCVNGGSLSLPASSLIFLGTGCSSAVPNARCLIQPPDPPCAVCSQSLSIPPEKNPNYRCNTSLLIDYCREGGEHKYILIDVGKNFREQVLRWFTQHKIPQVDSIILTHEHADAILGLDDIRVVQPFSHNNDIDPTPVYLTEYAMDSITQKFPYLVKRKLKDGEELRRVAQLDWKIIESDLEKTFFTSGLEFVPLPVMHGEDYLSLGFLFGKKSRIAYISDVSRFPATTEHFISKSGGGQLDLLILDTLYKVLSMSSSAPCPDGAAVSSQAESANPVGSVGSSRSGKVLRKNAPGNKSDPGWSHGYAVDGDNRKIKCKYCQKIISGGVYRLKHHLACTQKDVGGCMQVPEKVKREMFEIVYKIQEQLTRKSQMIEDIEENKLENSAQVGEKRKEMESSSSIFRRKTSQSTINSMFKKEEREEACMAIAKFFYNNAIPFNVAKSEEFHNMCELVACHGKGFKPPSYHEIRVKYLRKQIELTNEVIEEHKAEWKKVGCTIMTDGWTDRKRRTIINFLVNSPKGTVFLKSIDASSICKTAIKVFEMIDNVIEEVGEDNVVHVVTDNAASYKAAGAMLMAKRKKLYWTPCAAHCIDLMLEDFGKKLSIHKETIANGKKITGYIYSKTSLIVMLQHFTQGKDLIRPAVTRFATSYLTLGCLQDNKGALMRMFTSNEWKSSRFYKTKDGKCIEDIALDSGFWKNVIYCLRAAYPLIKVLRLVDSEEKPAMGFIYHEMDNAKEKIQKAYNGVKKCYQPVLDIIDERWDKQLHRPLHAAAYFLNPQFQYNSNFKADIEVKHGLYECLHRMVPDDVTCSRIDAQLEDFKHKQKFFGSRMANNAIYTKHPANWWDSYGYEHPELTNFAIRILSLTCSSSGCERNWSAFERVHTKKRNRLKQKMMNDVVYVMTNSKLEKRKQARKSHECDMDDLSSDDEWIVEENDELNLEEIDDENGDNSIFMDENISNGVSVGSTSFEDLTIPNDDIIHDKDDVENVEHHDENEEDAHDDIVDGFYDETNLNDLL